MVQNITPKTKSHNMILNGAAKLVNGRNESLSFEAKPTEAPRYGLLAANIEERSTDKKNPPIAKSASPFSTLNLNKNV